MVYEQLISRFLGRSPARFADLGFPEPPSEMWNGYPVWISVEGHGDEANGAVIAIGVLSSGRLSITRRSVFPWNLSSLPRAEVPRIAKTLNVRGDSSLAQRLFAVDAMVKTLPLAIKRGDRIDVFANVVRVYRRAVDGSAKDAIGAARATAMAVVSTLNLPPARQ